MGSGKNCICAKYMSKNSAVEKKERNYVVLFMAIMIDDCLSILSFSLFSLLYEYYMKII